MKVLLLRDVYKLGLAGEVKKVANGYGRNFLFPRKLAVPATAGAMKQAEAIREAAAKIREQENLEKASLSEKLAGLVLSFSANASEKGRLFGSVTHQMIANQIAEKTGEDVDRRSIIGSAIRDLGVHNLSVRLTADLLPEVTVVVHREDEDADTYLNAVEEVEEVVEAVEEAVEEVADAVEEAVDDATGAEEA